MPDPVVLDPGLRLALLPCSAAAGTRLGRPSAQLGSPPGGVQNGGLWADVGREEGEVRTSGPHGKPDPPVAFTAVSQLSADSCQEAVGNSCEVRRPGREVKSHSNAFCSKVEQRPAAGQVHLKLISFQ